MASGFEFVENSTLYDFDDRFIPLSIFDVYILPGTNNTPGGLYTWGYNQYGKLGDETQNNTSSPVQIGGQYYWKQIYGGDNHTLAIQTDGTLWAWGFNNYGQLGDGTTVNKSSPIQVGTLTNWSRVECGDLHTAAIKTDGTLWAWGSCRCAD
jgi:alpha-tubulin suppressor-like RCC1 family protein